MAATITIPLEEMRKRIVAKSYVAENGCRIWTGAKQTNGYGSICSGGRGNSMLVHRAAYLAFVGLIPDGMTIDHVCHNRARLHCAGGRSCLHRLCVDHEHLEAVTGAENTWRGRASAAIREFDTHCLFGHEMTEANTFRSRDRSRSCLTCHEARPQVEFGQLIRSYADLLKARAA